MILAADEKGRRAALDKLLPEQRADFTQIFEVMAGLPVTIRLLDPPLHEFLPHEEAEFAEVAAAAGVDVEILKRRAAELHEFNPMLGHRGRSEEHTSELQSLMRNSYAGCCLKKKQA